MQATDAKSVTLAIPPKAEYFLLARLALSAVCRLAPLAAEDAADLKLAVTEAATLRAREDGNLSFAYMLDGERIEVEIAGGEQSHAPGAEEELSRSIVEATVDDCDFADEATRLVKYIEPTTE